MSTNSVVRVARCSSNGAYRRLAHVFSREDLDTSFETVVLYFWKDEGTEDAIKITLPSHVWDAIKAEI